MEDELKEKKVSDMTGEELSEIVSSSAPNTGIGFIGFIMLWIIILLLI